MILSKVKTCVAALLLLAGSTCGLGIHLSAGERPEAQGLPTAKIAATGRPAPLVSAVATGAAAPADRKAPAAFRANITRIDEADASIVLIDAGLKRGLKANDKLEAIRFRPEPAYLGAVEILEVMPNFAVGRIKLAPGQMVRVGDQVASQLVPPKKEEPEKKIDSSPSAVSTLGERLAIGEKATVTVYDARNGKILWKSLGHKDDISALSFSPDDKLLASADRSGLVCLWDGLVGRQVLSVSLRTPIITVFFNGNRLIAVDNERTQHEIDVATGGVVGMKKQK